MKEPPDIFVSSDRAADNHINPFADDTNDKLPAVQPGLFTTASASPTTSDKKGTTGIIGEAVPPPSVTILGRSSENFDLEIAESRGYDHLKEIEDLMQRKSGNNVQWRNGAEEEFLSFDDARLQFVQEKMLASNIDPDSGLPIDHKLFTFDSRNMQLSSPAPGPLHDHQQRDVGIIYPDTGSSTSFSSYFENGNLPRVSASILYSTDYTRRMRRVSDFQHSHGVFFSITSLFLNRSLFFFFFAVTLGLTILALYFDLSVKQVYFILSSTTGGHGGAVATSSSISSRIGADVRGQKGGIGNLKSVYESTNSNGYPGSVYEGEGDERTSKHKVSN
ncbi:unnamed protein product [Amoebophrya sp. A120]|nr:unnamed protein product [Amoebophrya sp. A120]|eukprot:GSA120T00008849001.1